MSLGKVYIYIYSVLHDRPIGLHETGLNADQRKRLTIGIELAARPELIVFLDEPTSGLDSDTAWAIGALLRRLADQGLAILCTLHQPSTCLFQMFDELLLLKEGGQTIYSGQIGERSSAVIGYFEKHGARSCKGHENPAEWLMEVTSQSCSENQSVDWADLWQRSDARQQIKQQISQMNAVIIDSNPDITTRKTPSFMKQLGTTAVRLFSHYWRTPSYLYSKAALCIFTVSSACTPSIN